MTRKTPQGRLRPYQDEAVAFLHGRDSAALFLDMGLGKTLQLLTLMLHVRDEMALVLDKVTLADKIEIEE